MASFSSSYLVSRGGREAGGRSPQDTPHPRSLVGDEAGSEVAPWPVDTGAGQQRRFRFSSGHTSPVKGASEIVLVMILTYLDGSKRLFQYVTNEKGRSCVWCSVS